MTTDPAVFLAELAQREKVLTQEIAERTAELAKVRGAIAALRVYAGEGPGLGTREAIRAFTATLDPGAKISVSALLAWAQGNGWRSTSPRPRETLLQALAHLVPLGEISKSEHGDYYVPGPGRRPGG